MGFSDFIAEILDEWSGDEVDELFELLEGHMAEAGLEIKYAPSDADDEEEDEPEEEDDDEEEADEVGFVEEEPEEL